MDVSDVSLPSIETACETIANWSLARLSEGLRRLGERAGSQLDDEVVRLLHGLQQAAADTDRIISRQEARIRFLEGLSVTDELTNVLNRRGFENELARAKARAKRNGETGLLLLCDLNGFKAINDTYGHLVGDRVLVAVARVLETNTRSSDYVARIGGDEFAVLMTDTDRMLGEKLARKLESLVNGHVLVYRNREVPISASFGFEAYGMGSCFETVFGAADQALYRNKMPTLVAATA
jgi:diguanylate cyclase (GGDEF)-like protein